MQNKKIEERKCMFCKKTIKSSKKINICQNCRNSIQQTSLVVLAAGVGVFKIGKNIPKKKG